MQKVAIVILADIETHEASGRVTNALTTAKELQENQDEVKLIFDGASARWIPELEDENHKMHPLYKSVKSNVAGVCKFCAKAFGVINEIRKTDVLLLDDFEQHPSLRKYIANGYQIITF